jgi:hypothetical protein
MAAKTSRRGGNRSAKLITLSPYARLLLERAAKAANMSHSRLIEQLVELHSERLIAEEKAAMKVLTKEAAVN